MQSTCVSFKACSCVKRQCVYPFTEATSPAILNYTEFWGHFISTAIAKLLPRDKAKELHPKLFEEFLMYYERYLNRFY